MSRAALLLTVGEPYLLNLWLEYYEKVWSKEVDKVYVYLDNREDSNIPNINKYLRELFSKYPNIEVQDSEGMGIANAIQKSIQGCKEDYFVLLNDDCIIFKPGALDYCFKQLENGKYDVIGSPLRNYTPQEFDFELSKQFEYSQMEHELLKRCGYAFWQNLFFAKTSDALKTNMDMDVETWEKGKDSYFNKSFDFDIGLDIFVSFSWQLRKLGLRFDYIKQGHTTTNDVNNFITMQEIFSGNYSWVHIGNLSTLTVYLRGGWNKLEPNQSMIDEYQRTIAWREIMMERYPLTEIPKYTKVFEEVISQIYQNLPLSKEVIYNLKYAYRRLLGI